MIMEKEGKERKEKVQEKRGRDKEKEKGEES